MLELRNIWHAYQDHTVLQEIQCVIEDETLVGVLGPNGSGKSTLFRIIAGLINPSHGQVLIRDQALKQFSNRKKAQTLSLLRQASYLDHQLTVQEYVLLGRLPYHFFWQSFDQNDFEKLDHILEELHLTALKDRLCIELSGGEAQRVLLARCLIQETPLILLDEPTRHLDIKSQIEILDWLILFKKKLGKTVMIVFHDLLLAKHYCSHLLMIKNKTIMAYGKTSDVLNQSNVEKLYDLESSIYVNELLK